MTELRRIDTSQFYPPVPKTTSADDEAYGEEPERPILEQLKAIPSGETVLDNGAGYGIYTRYMILERGLNVIAGDIDEGALTQLRNSIPAEKQAQLRTDVFDAVNDDYPQGADNSLCSFFLYLFPEEIIDRIVSKTSRALPAGGRFVFNVLTDVDRRDGKGNQLQGPLEARYSNAQGERMVQRVLGHNSFTVVEITRSQIADDLPNFKLDAKSLNVLAVKR